MTTMTKADFVGAVAEQAGVTKAIAEQVINAIDAVTRAKVAEGATVPVAGVGKVSAVNKPEREMRNPATGETFMKPAHRAPKVSIGKALKDALGA